MTAVLGYYLYTSNKEAAYTGSLLASEKSTRVCKLCSTVGKEIFLLFRSSGGITLCLHDRVSVCVSVCHHFGIHFFIGLYLFNTATDHVHFWHACTLGPG